MASAPARGPDRKLSKYRAMRDFGVTSEPSGRERVKQHRGLGFVIQAHAASRMHYDFRLELGGVLLSWSVPKGPCLSPGERRLAVRTEDHPLAYAGFEGIIPAGQYGGGTVVVWDRGTWEPDGEPEAGLKKGRLTFTLHGDKLRGRWHLVRTRLDEGKSESWLLFKGKDEHASDDRDIVRERPESVVSGRTLEQVAEAADAVWQSNRTDGGDDGGGKAKPRTFKAELAALAAARTSAPPERSGSRKRAAESKGAAASSPPRRAARGTRPPAPEAGPPEDLIALVKSLPVGFGLTSLDKVLYREQGLTKAALLAYLAVSADWLLPHVADRPLTLVRCPEGAGKQCFYQKHLKPGTPPPIKPLPIPDSDGEVRDYMRISDMPGLIGLAQMGTLEIHTWGCHADRLERPDLMVFDLDPDESVGWDRVVETAVTMREGLASLGLRSFVKTTGGKGLHVVVPVARRLDWEAHEAFTRAFAERMVAAAPSGYTTNMSKAKRKGKIFLDYLRNGRGATFVAPYSPRARAGATVAVPVTWEELEAGLDPASFTIATVPPRLASLPADPWAGISELQPVTAAARKAVGL